MFKELLEYNRKLPVRVQKNLEAQQYQSEILVAVIQLIVIAILYLIYISFPKGFVIDAPIYSVPFGLSLFAILVVTRLYFTYTKQLTDYFLGCSVILEMLILMLTIWTYHIQFESPAIVNLKNTHFNYVFILIALRSLRFEPLWVLLSGLTAAACWTAIVINAMYTAEGNVMTWDYVTYVTTSMVHLGGEFDKVLAILLVTFIVTIGLVRSRSILLQAVTQTQAAEDLSRFFDTGVAKKITGSENVLQPGQGELRATAVMFTDLRGFTIASSKLSPEGLIQLLGEYQSLLVPIIQKYGGNIDKFIGDGILASFGAVVPSVTYAADALNAADEIAAAVKLWKEERSKRDNITVNVGMGLASGQVVFGVIGFENRLEYTLIGETVNLAAKLEKHNKVEKANGLTTMETLEVAISQGYIDKTQKERRMNSKVGGVDKPVDLVVLA
jgi:adenylate cyclase